MREVRVYHKVLNSTQPNVPCVNMTWKMIHKKFSFIQSLLPVCRNLTYLQAQTATLHDCILNYGCQCFIKNVGVKRCSPYPNAFPKLKFISDIYILLSILLKFQAVKIDILYLLVYICSLFTTAMHLRGNWIITACWDIKRKP